MDDYESILEGELKILEEHKLRLKQIKQSTSNIFSPSMVRIGEYSPNNPKILPPGNCLLGLGEYEEKRRKLLEEKKKEYQEQLAQIRTQSSPVDRHLKINENSVSFNPSGLSDISNTYHNKSSRQSQEVKEQKLSDISEDVEASFWPNPSQKADITAKRLAYQEELKKQIEEKHRLEEERRERERRQEEALMKHIAEQQAKLREEFEREHAERKAKEEQESLKLEKFHKRYNELKEEADHLKKQKHRKFHPTDSSDVPEQQASASLENASYEASLPVPALRSKLESLKVQSGTYSNPDASEIDKIKSDDSYFPLYKTESEAINSYKPKISIPISHSANHIISSNNSRETLEFIPRSMTSSGISEKDPRTSGDVSSRLLKSSQSSRSNSNTLIKDLPQERIILRTVDPLSEARPGNILTQLGAFRRQMQADLYDLEQKQQNKAH